MNFGPKLPPKPDISPRSPFMDEAVGAVLLALATLRLWHLQKYVHEVGL
jgi:hypothetical protein